MAKWYHSGIEGYCKAMAELAGMPDDASGWGNFGRDLFGDGRFDDPVKASKTWTLSRSRTKGRSNRPMLFEKSWLGMHGPLYESAAVAACATFIVDGAASAASAAGAESAESAESASDGAAGESSLHSLYSDGYLAFANGFRAIVLPAISDGFTTERYHSADIRRFEQTIIDLLNDLVPNGWETLYALAVKLVAGLIYGPSHGIVRNRQADATRLATDWKLASLFSEDETVADGIRITQLFNADLALTGYSELFADDKAVFFGRGGDVEHYLQKCSADLAHELQRKTCVIFPVASSHMRTSSEHGVLAKLGDNWYYYDFSSNGTTVFNGKASMVASSNADVAGVAGGDDAGEPFRFVHEGVIEVLPGDRLCLGLQANAIDPAMFRAATTVLISLNAEDTGVG